ncbi:NADPH:quinone reductase-like Zn-dependent oxidoreductase [Pseudochelatococcus lubricantis]|uniref:NADPH:quinone reductase-like Zn-dependent oxidoreductase n=1 Tax=Pseudochelatococcus lubricantis TaxID=1538102 RepID=A0ABX0UXG7_9HYPH|nr:zinc-binding dehydrogenase [Pseudochelatococcus lubricantis]NIJ57626.1 NADPH:quinone reductase-like Zn-dependent oxidoreductase [Pseudochelatococcus lubricantis]
MKAIVLKERGAAGVVYDDIPAPPQPEGGVRVRMLAASVNRVDLYMRDNGAGITHSLPQVMGVDGVGEVMEADIDAGVRPDERVLLYPYEFCGVCRHCLAGDQPLCRTARIPGEHRDGTFAEQISLPARSLVKLRPDADVDQAAVLGVAYLTAWRMVFGKAPAGPGSVVLVQGAGGGVSYAAVQLARMAGARVIVTTTGEDKLAHFRALSVDAVDYRTADVAKAVLSLTDGEGADLVIDNVGEKTWGASLRSMARGGHLVTCGATTGAHPSADIQRLFVRQLSVHGSTMGNMEEFRRLIRAWESGGFTPLIDSVFPLTEVPAAFARLEHPARLGKIVIRIAESTETS